MTDELKRLPDETLAEYLDRAKKMGEKNTQILEESTNMTEWIKNQKSQEQMKNFRLNTMDQPFDFVEATPYESYYTPPAALNHIDGLMITGGGGSTLRDFSWGADSTKYSNMQQLIKKRAISNKNSYFTFLRNTRIDKISSPTLYYSCLQDIVMLNIGVNRNNINYSWIKNLKIIPKTTANKETRLSISNSSIQGLDVENLKSDSDNPNLLSSNIVFNSNFKKYNNVEGQITQNHFMDCDFTSANLRKSVIGKNAFYQCDFTKVRFWSAQINDRRASSTAYDVSFGVDKLTKNQFSHFLECIFEEANFKEANIGSGFSSKSLIGMNEMITPYTTNLDDELNPIGYAKYSDSNNQWKNSYMRFTNSSFTKSILKDTSMNQLIMDNCTFNYATLDRTTIQSSYLTNNTFYGSKFGQDFNRNGLTLKNCMINNMSFIKPLFSLQHYSSPILIEKCSSANLIKEEPLADLPLDMRMSYFYYLLNKIDNNYNDRVISNDIALASLFLDNGYTTDVVFQEKHNELGTQPNDTIKQLDIVGSDLDILFDDIKVADGNIINNNLRISTKDTTFKRTYFCNNNVGLFRKRFRSRRYRGLSPEVHPIIYKSDMPTRIYSLLGSDNSRGTHPLEIMPELSIRGELPAIGSDYLFGKMENTKFEHCIFELQESQFDWDWNGEEELINDMAELREFINEEGRPIFNSTILKNRIGGDGDDGIIYGGVDANIPQGDLLFNPKAYKFIPLNFLVSMAKKGVEMDNCLIFPNSIRNMGSQFSGSVLSNLLRMVRNIRNEELSQEVVKTRISGAMMQYRSDINRQGIYPAPLIFSIKEGIISSPYFITEENPYGNICRLTSSLNPLLYGIGESNYTEGLSPLEISNLHFDMLKRKEEEPLGAGDDDIIEEEFVNDESFFDESFLERDFSLSFNQYLHQNELTDDEGTITTLNDEALKNATIDWLIVSQRKLGIDNDELEREVRLIRNSPLSWVEWLSNYDLRPSAIEGTPLDFWMKQYGSLKEYLQINRWITSQGIWVDNSFYSGSYEEEDRNRREAIATWFGRNRRKMNLDDYEIDRVITEIRFGEQPLDFWLEFFDKDDLGYLDVDNL